MEQGSKTGVGTTHKTSPTLTRTRTAALLSHRERKKVQLSATPGTAFVSSAHAQRQQGPFFLLFLPKKGILGSFYAKNRYTLKPSKKHMPGGLRLAKNTLYLTCQILEGARSPFRRKTKEKVVRVAVLRVPVLLASRIMWTPPFRPPRYLED